MEFEDEDRDEEEVEDYDNDNDNGNEPEPEPEPEPETMTLLTLPTFHTHHHHNNNNNNNNSSNKKHSAVVPRYRECLKNHAVNIGGHAVDGCGEFMPAGPDGTIDALKCAACNCHRNFHRKEYVSAADDNHHQLTLYHPPPPHVYQFYYPAAVPSPAATPTTPPVRPLALPPSASAEDQVTGGMMAMTMTTSTSTGKKRHRTKFSQEQKDKMFGLAERLGWKIQKCDENVIQQFCDESGVKRHVLKVWMHNNKHTLGKKPPC
ncbi:zinc-finger homeodomain protein 2-like [Silene latifolia]|uniref:zinc-finger homeodomain protein 2-like n=1 Tax=Silene latifolia TaxID=37657 RepID=UPI003D776269